MQLKITGTFWYSIFNVIENYSYLVLMRTILQANKLFNF